MMNQIVQGVLLGGYYALIACGLSFMFSVMRIINLAHGSLAVLSAFALWLLASRFHIAPFYGLAIVLPLMAAIGWALQRFLLERSARGGALLPILTTFGLAIVLRNGMVSWFGANSQSINVGNMRFWGFDFLGMRLGVLPVLVLAIAIMLFAALRFWLNTSRMGRIIRATADDHQVVQLLGVNYRNVYAIAMGIALALSAVAGVLLAMRGSFTPYSGADRLLIAFEVVVIGGLGSFWGMFIGGIVLGVTQLVALKLDPAGGLMYGHIVFFIILILSPKGLSSILSIKAFRK